MTPQRAAAGDLDRLAAFKAANPGVPVLAFKGRTPMAWPALGQPTIEKPTLGELIDALEEIFPPGMRAPGGS